MFKKITLKNGLRIILAPIRNTQAVTVLVLVATGSKYETKETNGISHLLEHLLFKGTKKRPNKIAIAEPLDRIGGIYNAFTSEDYTGYYAKVSSEHLNLALDIISDIYLNSQLPEEEIQREKKVIIEEINMYRDQPDVYVQSLWNKVLYGDQPAGWDIAGTKRSVLRISRSELQSYMKRQYSAKNTVLCLAGALPGIEKSLRKAKEFFKNIKKRKTIKKPKVLENQKKPKVLVLNKDTDQTHFCLGVRGFNLFNPKKYTKELISLILGGMMSSRLFLKIREEMGLAYYIKTISSSDPDTGYLYTQAGVATNKAKEAIKEILKEYKRLTREEVSKKELEKAKEHFKGKMDLYLETSDAIASFYGTQEILENRIYTSREIFAKINKVTVSDIRRISQEIFRPEKLNLALIGPFKEKKEFQEILKL